VTSSVSVPKLPGALPSEVDDVEAILEDEIINTPTGSFQRFLVCWKGHPQFDNSWIQEDDLRRPVLICWMGIFTPTLWRQVFPSGCEMMKSSRLILGTSIR